MSEGKKYAVPGGMLTAATIAWQDHPASKGGRAAVVAAIEAALAWQENEILHAKNVDFHRAILEAEKERWPGPDTSLPIVQLRVSFEYGTSFARNYIASLYHAPEPHPLEDLKDLFVSTYQSIPHRWNVRRHANGVVEVCRGDHEKNEGCEWEDWAAAPEAKREEPKVPPEVESLFYNERYSLPSKGVVNSVILEAYNRGKKAASK